MTEPCFADTVFLHGQVLTMVPGSGAVQALAIRRGRVMATGTDAEMIACTGPETRIVDLAGRTLLPGLIDAHAHMEREGLKTLRPSLEHARTIADVLAVVARAALATPKGGWIITMPVGVPPFYFGGPSNLAEGRMPNRDELDAVTTEHPVYIPGLFGNWGVPPGHSALNSLALELNHIEADTCPDCSGLTIELDATGRPNGVIVETNKRPLVEFSILTQVPPFGFDDRLEGLKRSLPIYHACGTTSVYEGHGSSPETIAVYRRLWEEGGLTMRTRLVVSPTWSNVEEATLAMRDWLCAARGRGLGDPWLSIGGVYIGLGGDKAAAAAVKRSLPNTGWMGFVEWANRIEDFTDYAWLAAEHDLRVHSVVNDRLPEVLDAFEAIDARFPLAGRRWVVEHVGQVRTIDIPRIQRLGLMVTTIPFYVLWKNGASRLATADVDGDTFLPQRRMLEAGLPIAAGSDNIPVSPWTAVWASVVRQERTTGRVIGPHQALDRWQALQTVTRNGAYLSFEEDRKGTLVPGAFADLAVLNVDPLTVAADALASIHAESTWVDGREVHSRTHDA